MATLARVRPTVRAPLWIGLAGTAVFILHVPSFMRRLMDGDEAVYGGIAALMNLGGRLYADGGVDNKPPGVYWLYAGIFEIFGRYQMTAVHIVGLVVVAATCVVLMAIGQTIANRRAGLVAAVLYGVLTATGNPRLLATNTEVLMALPLTAAFLLMLRRQWLWSGALIVVAGAFKQVAAVEVLLLPVGLLLLELRGSRMRAAAFFAGGIALGLVAGAALLAVTGSLGGFWRWTVETLVGYASANWSPGNLWSRSQDSLIPFFLYGAVAWIAALAFVARWRILGPAERMAVAWFGLSFAGSIVAGHWSWHYFIQVMPPLALLAALAIEPALNWNARRWAAAVAIVGVIAPALYWFNFNLHADPLTYDWSPPIAQHELVAQSIDSHSGPNDRIFVWGDWPALYIESNRLMASRFPGFLRGFARGSDLPPNNWDTAPDVWPELQSDLVRNPPALIVDTSTAGWSDFAMYPMRNYPVLQELVTTNYHLVAVVGGVAIYARNN
jgi:4-amino-4-deoxy-L-arabinose transferase-like glycosyltransferase